MQIIASAGMPATICIAASCRKRMPKRLQIWLGKCGGGYRNSVYLTGYKPSSEYIGCFKDSSPRALEVHLGNGFTLDGCIEDCFNKGFKYAGLQFKSECRCGHTGYDKYGGVRPESECSMDCTTGSGICGGPGRNSVYATGFEPIAEYKGCYKDQSDRALSHKVGPNQSLDECKTKCQDKGYYYFALQSGNYCFCGAFDDDFDKYGKVNDSEWRKGAKAAATQVVVVVGEMRFGRQG
ncbi:WSC domain-containing protein 2 [Seminavis robusta]|uniref:WSC domain-containing protein 2 n=1 Tax=Seminavis robusta TaxID=568900 RepID=A0A9N8HS78_9STRA|nr:WSC domain-containing protein 2 [Seminavis robusta]|eukprot:Sro1356_g265640.1 WSC domain-containing protein 2 (237) ;mRNA; f:1651-2656